MCPGCALACFRLWLRHCRDVICCKAHPSNKGCVKRDKTICLTDEYALNSKVHLTSGLYGIYIYIPYNPLVRCTLLLSAYSSVRHIVLSRLTHPLLGGCALLYLVTGNTCSPFYLSPQTSKAVAVVR